MNGSIGKAHDRLDNVEPHVEDYKVTKQRAVMGLIGIGGLTGVIGGKMAELLGGIIR